MLDVYAACMRKAAPQQLFLQAAVLSLALPQGFK